MSKAEYDKETGEVVVDGYYCPPWCGGCACHRNPPCSHCEQHWYEAGQNVYEDKEVPREML